MQRNVTHHTSLGAVALTAPRSIQRGAPPIPSPDRERRWRTLHYGLMELRQSLKMVALGYAICVMMSVAIVAYYYAAKPPDYVLFLLVIPVILSLFVVIRHIQRRMVKITVLGDRLRYQSGFFSKRTETVELSKVQDVRVDQTLAQRIFNIGNISLETAGGSSRIAMPGIDSPQVAADHILTMAQAAGRNEGLK